MSNRVVVESPLTGDHVRNFRFLLWCLRAVWVVDKTYGLASHLINPWFMDDGDADERTAGMNNEHVWQPDVPHWLFLDLGMSGGMTAAIKRCEGSEPKIPLQCLHLSTYHLESWAAFERGEWPPRTAGFEIAILPNVVVEQLKAALRSVVDFGASDDDTPAVAAARDFLDSVEEKR